MGSVKATSALSASMSAGMASLSVSTSMACLTSGGVPSVATVSAPSGSSRSPAAMRRSVPAGLYVTVGVAAVLIASWSMVILSSLDMVTRVASSASVSRATVSTSPEATPSVSNVAWGPKVTVQSLAAVAPVTADASTTTVRPGLLVSAEPRLGGRFSAEILAGAALPERSARPAGVRIVCVPTGASDTVSLTVVPVSPYTAALTPTLSSALGGASTIQLPAPSSTSVTRVTASLNVTSISVDEVKMAEAVGGILSAERGCGADVAGAYVAEPSPAKAAKAEALSAVRRRADLSPAS